MTWLLEYAPEVCLAIGLGFGFAAGLAYAHGSEGRSYRRVAKSRRSTRADIRKAWKR